MNQNLLSIEEKLLELKKYNGTITIAFNEHHIRFSKDFGKRTFQCVLVSNNLLKSITAEKSKIITTLNYKNLNGNFAKNYKVSEIENILNEIEVIFSNVFDIDVDSQMTLINKIEYSLNPSSVKSGKKINKLAEKTEKAFKDKSSDNALKTVGILILVVLIFALISKKKTGPVSDNSMIENRLSDLSGHETHAFITSEKFIKRELISPRSAEFGYYDEAKVTFVGNNAYRITNFVDCQNAYGVLIRHNYSITLNFNGGMWEDLSNWQVTDLQID